MALFKIAKTCCTHFKGKSEKGKLGQGVFCKCIVLLLPVATAAALAPCRTRRRRWTLSSPCPVEDKNPRPSSLTLASAPSLFRPGTLTLAELHVHHGRRRPPSNRRRPRPPRSKWTTPTSPHHRPLPPPRAVRAREPPVARIAPAPPTLSAAVRARFRRRSSSSAFTERAVELRVRCSSSRTPCASSSPSRSC